MRKSNREHGGNDEIKEKKGTKEAKATVRK